MVETKINGWKSREAARAQVPPMDQLFLDLTASCKKFVEFGIFTRKKLLQLRKGYFLQNSPPQKNWKGGERQNDKCAIAGMGVRT